MKHALTHRLPEDDLDGARGRPRLMLLLSAGRDHYAIDVRQVAEIVVSVELTPLPNAPDIVLGVFNLQGRTQPSHGTAGRDASDCGGGGVREESAGVLS